MPSQSSIFRTLSYLFGSLVFFGVFLFLNHSIGMRQLGGFDIGPMLHLLAQLVHGHSPNIDFPSPYPPIFGWGLLLASHIFGISWQSFVDFGGVFAATCAIFVFFIWRHLTHPLLAFFLSVTAAIQSSLLLGIWWYGPPALWFSLIFIGVAANISQSASNLSNQKNIFILIGLCAILFFNKPNTIAPILFFSVLHLALPARLMGCHQPKIAIFMLFGGTAVALGLCFSGNFDPFFYIQLIFHLGGRLSNPIFFTPDFAWAKDFRLSGGISFVLTVIGFSFISKKIFFKHFQKHFFWLFFALIVSFCTSFFLNGEYPLASCPLLGAALLLMVGKKINRQALFIICLSWIVSGGYAFVKAEKRDRMWAPGEGQFFEYSADLKQSDGFFNGLVTGPRFYNFSRETSFGLKLLHPQRVFFGPRVEFGYIQFNVLPPKGLPLWWDPRSAYANTNQAAAEIINSWFASNFEVLVFDRGDASFMPKAVVDDITSNYISLSEQMGISESTILVRKTWWEQKKKMIPLNRISMLNQKEGQ